MRAPVITVNLVVVCLCATATLSQGAISQSRTIPEMLSDAGRSVVRTTSAPSGVPPTVASLLTQTDAIVEATVMSLDAHLADDKRDVVTDCRLESVRIWHRGNRNSAPEESPIVTVPGGTVTVGNFTFSSKYEGAPDLQVGRRYLFLLRSANGILQPVSIYFSVFSVEGGSVMVVSPKVGFAEDYQGLTVADAASRMEKELRRQGR